MDSRRPRHSVLTLFDPLLGSPKTSLDKENNVGDSSFFHPFRTTLLQQPAPTFRRRLIDVGDMTVDEPDMAELLAEEDDFNDQFNFDIPADDDNDTLKFRDIVKAATPKWSGKRFTTLTTPKSSPTPRTPLAQISLRDETTPIARKKPFKHQAPIPATKLTQVEVAEQRNEIIQAPHSPSNQIDPIQAPTLPSTSTPIIEVSLDASPISITPETSNGSREALGSSVCTLNIPQTTGNLIADTSNPTLISPSSSQSSLELSLPTNARLRPNATPIDHSHRHSVDLQSSFRLQLNSSDTTFDLLNEKISFLGSKDGGDSFLNNIDDSFGEDDFGGILISKDRVSVSNARLPQPLENDSKPNQATKSTEARSLLPLDQVKSVSIPEVAVNQIKSDIKQNGVKQTTSNTPIRNLAKTRPRSLEQSPREVHIIDKIDAALSELPRDVGMLSTPRSSSGLQFPSRPVPALKIVKRSRILTQPVTTHSRRISVSSTASHSTLDSTRSPASKTTSTTNESKQTDVVQTVRGVRRTIPSQAALPPSTNVDGPRRVLISEGPKLNHGSNTRASVQVERVKSSTNTNTYTSTLNGPRRIAMAGSNGGKPAGAVTGPSNGLKAPVSVKYGTVGTVSAIPKPVSRVAGSSIAGPLSMRTRTITNVTRGLPGR